MRILLVQIWLVIRWAPLVFCVIWLVIRWAPFVFCVKIESSKECYILLPHFFFSEIRFETVSTKVSHLEAFSSSLYVLISCIDGINFPIFWARAPMIHIRLGISLKFVVLACPQQRWNVSEITKSAFLYVKDDNKGPMRRFLLIFPFFFSSILWFCSRTLCSISWTYSWNFIFYSCMVHPYHNCKSFHLLSRHVCFNSCHTGTGGGGRWQP